MSSLYNDLRNSLEIRLFHNGSRGIVGKRKDQYLRLVRNGCLQLLCCQAEFILCLQVMITGVAPARIAQGS